jgi:glycosyltransferase involved in cell wall biosynthesis
MSNRFRGRIAYGTCPKIGGTFVFYKLLRQALRPYGWDVLAAVPGKYINDFWDPAYEDDGCVRIAPEEQDLKHVAQEIVDWCDKAKVDVYLPMSVQAMVSAIPHLPQRVHSIMRCSNITRHAYDIVTVHKEYVPKVIATSKRQWDDLIHRRRVEESRMVLIPHGTDLTAFSEAAAKRSAPGEILRLGFVGRLEQESKGIYSLRPILDQITAAGIKFELTVVGGGPDRRKLEQQLAPHREHGRVRLVGDQPHERVPRYLGEMDVFLMPSRFEGFGFSLIEAMASGCVPIVSGIRGVTDWIVEDGKTGFVCGIDKPNEFADRVINLAKDRTRLAQLSQASLKTSQERFSLERMGADYHKLFSEILQAGPWPLPPRPWSSFRECRAFEPAPQRWLPPFLAKGYGKCMQALRSFSL